MREIQLHALAFNFGLVVIAQRYTLFACKKIHMKLSNGQSAREL